MLCVNYTYIGTASSYAVKRKDNIPKLCGSVATIQSRS